MVSSQLLIYRLNSISALKRATCCLLFSSTSSAPALDEPATCGQPKCHRRSASFLARHHTDRPRFIDLASEQVARPNHLFGAP